MKQRNVNNIRGLYTRTEGGTWALDATPTKKKVYRDAHLLPPTITFKGGALHTDHPAYPSRIRLGAGPLASLGVGHFVHLLNGPPSMGTMYVYHRGDAVTVEIMPTGNDVTNPHHVGKRFVEIVGEWDGRAALQLGSMPYPASIPLSDDLPALYVNFA